MSLTAYALYGEDSTGFPDILHVETIAARSAIHDWRIRPHRHAELYQFFFVSHGGGTASIDGADLVIGPGSAIALPPLVVHNFAFDVGTDGYVVSIPASVLEMASSAQSKWRNLFATSSFRSVTSEEKASLEEILKLSLSEFSGRHAVRAEALMAFAGLILVWFGRALASEDAGNAMGARSSQLLLLQRFMEQVDRDFRRHPDLIDRARRLGVSVPYLTRVCRQLVGCSAHGVVQERVLLEARRYLLYTSMSVSEIAFALGFSDSAYFTRFFTRRMGECPTKYRQKPSEIRKE